MKSIRKVLMCKPLYFETLNYVINPWMTPGTINKKRAEQQWSQLAALYEILGITVAIIDQQKGNPDMVFAADQGIVLEKTILLSRFWCKERKDETTYYEKWFEENGYTLAYLPRGIYFEGNGDSFLWNDKLLIGTGYRADVNTCQAVSQALDCEVIPIKIVDPLFYHLDVGFFPLNNTTAFYYPPAFSDKSRGVLKKLVPNLLEFSKDEAYGFSANSLVTGKQVIHQTNNPTFQKKLEDLGYTSWPVDVGEFMKSGGGIHCLTNILETD